MRLYPLAPAVPHGVLVAFLTPRGRWWRRRGTVLSLLSGGGGDEPPPPGERRRRGGGGDWPLWLAVLVTTVIAVGLSALGIGLSILGGQAPGPYPPGP